MCDTHLLILQIYTGVTCDMVIVVLGNLLILIARWCFGLTVCVMLITSYHQLRVLAFGLMVTAHNRYHWDN